MTDPDDEMYPYHEPEVGSESWRNMQRKRLREVAYPRLPKFTAWHGQCWRGHILDLDLLFSLANHDAADVEGRKIYLLGSIKGQGLTTALRIHKAQPDLTYEQLVANLERNNFEDCENCMCI